MSDQQPDRYPSHQPDADLEYDLAHEETGESGNPARVEQRISVATGTPEYDGDYSYDLAHDIRSR